MKEKEFGGYLPLEITKDGKEYYQSNKSFNVISLSYNSVGVYSLSKSG